MRIASFAFIAPIALLAACGGPQTSQANNGVTSNVQARLSLGDAAKVMHERHEGMETIGKGFKAIHRELDAASPNLAAVHTAAAQIADLSRKASGWFPAGTGPDVGKTGAKPDIWAPQNKADFAAKLHNFQVAAQAFDAAAAGSDAAAIKARFADLGGTCKACHDKYRTEMHH